VTRAAPTPPSTTPPRPAAPAGARPNRTGLFATTTAVFLITTLVLLWTVLHPSSAPIKTGAIRQAAQTTVEDQVKTVASRFVTNLATFSYQTIDGDITKIEQDATPNFAHTTQAALGGTVDQFKANIIARQSVSKGDVKGTAVTSLDNDTATVLVVVVQNVRNKTTPENVKLHVLELTLFNNSGWKVDQVGNPETT